MEKAGVVMRDHMNSTSIYRMSLVSAMVAATFTLFVLAMVMFMAAPASAQSCSNSGGPPQSSCSGDPGSTSTPTNGGYPIEPPPGACGCIHSNPSPPTGSPTENVGLPACNGGDPGATCNGGSSGNSSGGSNPGPDPTPPPAFDCSDWTFGNACGTPSQPAQPTPPNNTGLICTVVGAGGCAEWRPAPTGGNPPASTTSGGNPNPGPATPGNPNPGPATPGNPTPGPAPTAPPPPPPVDPTQAIQAAINGLQLAPVVASNPDYTTRNALVLVPTWFWVTNPTDSNTATANGVTVTATATVQSVDWDFTVDNLVCPGPGIPYQDPEPANACTVTFTNSSAGYGASDRFPSQATALWEINYVITSPPPPGGYFPPPPATPTTNTGTTNFDLGVGEIQAVRN